MCRLACCQASEAPEAVRARAPGLGSGREPGISPPKPERIREGPPWLLSQPAADEEGKDRVGGTRPLGTRFPELTDGTASLVLEHGGACEAENIVPLTVVCDPAGGRVAERNRGQAQGEPSSLGAPKFP